MLFIVCEKWHFAKGIFAQLLQSNLSWGVETKSETFKTKRKPVFLKSTYSYNQSTKGAYDENYSSVLTVTFSVVKGAALLSTQGKYNSSLLILLLLSVS